MTPCFQVIVFFLIFLIFFFPNISNIAYWRFFPSRKQLLIVRNEQPALSISKFPRQYFKAKFSFSREKKDTMKLINDPLFPGYCALFPVNSEKKN